MGISLKALYLSETLCVLQLFGSALI